MRTMVMRTPKRVCRAAMQSSFLPSLFSLLGFILTYQLVRSLMNLTVASIMSMLLKSKLLICPMTAYLHILDMSDTEYPPVYSTTSFTSLSNKEFLSLATMSAMIFFLASP